MGINIILEDPLASLLALIDGVGISIKFVILSLRGREKRRHTEWDSIKAVQYWRK